MTATPSIPAAHAQSIPAQSATTNTAVGQTGPPLLDVKWFYASDAPKRDPAKPKLKTASLPPNTTPFPTNPTASKTASVPSKNSVSPPNSSSKTPPTSSSSSSSTTSHLDVNTRPEVSANANSSSSPVTSSPSRLLSGPFSTQVKGPTLWTAFSKRDSTALEKSWQGNPKGGKVAVNEDYLFEGEPIGHEYPYILELDKVAKNLILSVDVDAKEIYPVYWPGPVYEVRRGTWFFADAKGAPTPCDDNLARQVDDGYKKHAPWKIDASTLSADNAVTRGELRWPLLGPYHDQSVVFMSPVQAWLVHDGILGKLAKAVWTKFSPQTLGGRLLLRGYDEAMKKGTPEKDPTEGVPVIKDGDKSDTSTRSAPDGSAVEGSASGSTLPVSTSETDASSNAEAFSKVEEEKPERDIDHLVFVIHGIGQKLSEHMESVNFVNDVNVLRRTLKLAAGNLSTASQSQPPPPNRPASPSSNVHPDSSSSTFASASSNHNSSTAAPSATSADGSALLDASASSLSQLAGQGVQVLPIQWRKDIKFGMAATEEKEESPTDTDMTDLDWDDVKDGDGPPTLDDITIDGVPGIRMIVTDVLLDILLYMTPKYQKLMMDGVVAELNRVYRLFVTRNPDFLERGGRVSMYAHSLGSVIAFDVVCAQQLDGGSAMLPPTFSSGTSTASLADLAAIQLDFQVDNLFAVGSPIGLFLLLKGCKIGPKSLEGGGAGGRKSFHEDAVSAMRPACNAIYNIFHNADPVAFRQEPLVGRFRHSDGTLRKPASVPYLKGGLKGHLINIQEVGSGVVRNVTGVLGAVKSAVAHPFVRLMEMKLAVGAAAVAASAAAAASKTAESNDAATSSSPSPSLSQQQQQQQQLRQHRNPHQNLQHSQQQNNPHHHHPRSSSPVVHLTPRDHLEMLNPKTHRIDWSLQEGLLENAYLSALQVHVTYWGDYDVAMFMLKQMM